LANAGSGKLAVERVAGAIDKSPGFHGKLLANVIICS